MNFLDRFNLRPNEQRLVVIILIVLFVVLNLWFVRPQFRLWKPTQIELAKQRQKLIDMQNEVDNAAQYKKKKDQLEGQGGALLPEEAGVQLRRNIDNQINQSGIGANGINDQPSRGNTDSIFEERGVTMGFVNTGEKELIDFLYNISKERSTIRVRDLSVRPDPQLQRLQGSMTLVASYQKKGTVKPASKPAVTAKPAEPSTDKKENKPTPKLPPSAPKNPPAKNEPAPKNPSPAKSNKPSPTAPKSKPESSQVERSPLLEKSRKEP